MISRVNHPQPLNGNEPQIIQNDSEGMRQALHRAAWARQLGEVPVGAVICHQGMIIAEGWNCPIQKNDPTAHAEIQVIRQAAKQMANYRLDDCTLYVTLEPCAMCVGAMVHARIKRVVFGALDPKAGAVCSQINLLNADFFNKKIEWQSEILADECGTLLRQFFQERR